MIKLKSLSNNEEVPTGSIIRCFGVHRFDVMKLATDRTKKKKMKKDYYDYILVGLGAINKNTFCLVNITVDNNNRGHVLWIFETADERTPIFALNLKKYFQKMKVWIDLNK